MPAVRLLVFDLDGTLVDSRRDLATAVNATRTDLRLAELSLEEVVAKVGEGARNLVRRALPPEIQGPRFEEAFDTFVAHYSRVCLDTTLPYPGLEELLPRLARRLPLAVLTNKPEATSRRVLEGLDLASHFSSIVGGDTLPLRKPDPAGLHHLAAPLGVGPQALVLVGDSAIDQATARAAGSRFVLVEWGFASPGERAALDADAKVRDAGELAAALERWL